MAAAGGAGEGILGGGPFVPAVFAGPHRDAVAPPQLAADAPVTDTRSVHPVVVDLGEALRDDPDAPRSHGLDRRLGQRLDLDVPLRRDQRLPDLPPPPAARARHP